MKRLYCLLLCLLMLLCMVPTAAFAANEIVLDAGTLTLPTEIPTGNEVFPDAIAVTATDITVVSGSATVYLFLTGWCIKYDGSVQVDPGGNSQFMASDRKGNLATYTSCCSDTPATYASVSNVVSDSDIRYLFGVTLMVSNPSDYITVKINGVSFKGYMASYDDEYVPIATYYGVIDMGTPDANGNLPVNGGDFAKETKTTSGGGSYVASGQTVTTDLTGIASVKVDGKLVDSKYYTIHGTNVTLAQAYLNTLSNGTHVVKIENATRIATATITIQNSAVTSAKTFDVGVAVYVGMGMMAALGSAAVIGKKKEF